MTMSIGDSWTVLDRMGFGRNRIQVYTSSTSFSTLLNGAAEGFFRASRGLRQREPLSPFLFIIVTEALSKLVVKSKGGGFIRGMED